MMSYWGLLSRCLNSSDALGLISDTYKTYITSYKFSGIAKKKPPRKVLSSNCAFINMLILKDETTLCIIFRVPFHSCIVKNICFHSHFWETLYIHSTKTVSKGNTILLLSSALLGFKSL